MEKIPRRKSSMISVVIPNGTADAPHDFAGAHMVIPTLRSRGNETMHVYNPERTYEYRTCQCTGRISPSTTPVPVGQQRTVDKRQLHAYTHVIHIHSTSRQRGTSTKKRLAEVIPHNSNGTTKHDQRGQSPWDRECTVEPHHETPMTMSVMESSKDTSNYPVRC